jgi:hypothetical protein
VRQGKGWAKNTENRQHLECSELKLGAPEKKRRNKCSQERESNPREM